MFAAIVGQSWADDAHPYNLEINGVDRIAAMHYPETSIEMAGPGSNGSMQFTLQDPTASITINEWDEVRFIEHAATRPILFGGFVQSVRYVAWAAAGRSLVVQCVGYGILLDRKVVPAYVVPDDFVGEHVTSVVNRYGGRVSGLSPALGNSAATRNSWTSTPELTVTNPWDWWWAMPPVSGRPSVTAATTLRGVLDGWANLSSDAAYVNVAGMDAAGATPATGAAFWVDSYARLHAHPRLDETLGAANVNYDGTCSVAISETTGAGLVRAAEWDYELENSDLCTSAYVTGGNPAGTGYVRTVASERAGDLEAVVGASEATDAAARDAYGLAAVVATQPSVVRATVLIDSDTTLDIRPGQKMVASSTSLALASAAFLVAGVRVNWYTSTVRQYVVALGRSAPSMTNRSGDYATR